MVLATAKIADFDRFWNTFSTKGAEKRKQHGCKGAHLFRDPNESDRVWVIFDWDEAGWQSFTSDPEVPAIFQEAGFTQVRRSRRSSSASTTRRHSVVDPAAPCPGSFHSEWERGVRASRTFSSVTVPSG